jgi:acetate kinase
VGELTTILTVNAGSSSLRAHLVDPANERILSSAQAEEPPGSDAAMRALAQTLECKNAGKLDAVGLRLVHGGPHLREPTLVDDEVLKLVVQAASIAPLHVPPTLELVRQLRERLPDVPHVLCPDTAFHSDLPEVSRTLPLPREWRDRFGLRRYGFHGLSYGWASRRAAALLDRPLDDLQLLIAHLGGGGSVCAVRAGSSVDTSMCFTPLDGIPMTRRSGAVDPGLLMWLLSEKRLSLNELSEGLQQESGLLGLSDGLSADTRDLVRAARSGSQPARLAIDVYAYRVAQSLAGLAAALDRVDALVFTGEIGWDQPEVREAVCARLRILGIRPDLGGNRLDDGPVSRAGARIPVLVVETREELQIAAETAKVLDTSRIDRN